MTPLAKAKRRVQQLEKCLKDIGAFVQEADDSLTSHGADDESESPHYRLVMQITRRMGRTLPRK